MGNTFPLGVRRYNCKFHRFVLVNILFLRKKTILILLFITEKKGLTLTSSLKALSVHLKLYSSRVDLFGKETEIINLDDVEVNFYGNCSLMLPLVHSADNNVLPWKLS